MAKVKELEMNLPDDHVVNCALNSLLVNLGKLQTSYNAQREKWTLNELTLMCTYL